MGCGCELVLSVSGYCPMVSFCEHGDELSLGSLIDGEVHFYLSSRWLQNKESPPEIQFSDAHNYNSLFLPYFGGKNKRKQLKIAQELWQSSKVWARVSGEAIRISCYRTYKLNIFPDLIYK
jgi:hypothetical protein